MSRARDLADSADLAFDGNTLKIDSTNNRVGIGTDSPSTTFDVAGTIQSTTGTPQLRLQSSGTTGQSRLYFGDDSTFGAGYLIYDHASDYLKIATDGSERMRIDSSGNLLVGKTSLSTTNVGIENRADGLGAFTRDGNSPVIINRLTSDGTIIDFRKDGTTVGSIGTFLNQITVGKGSTGMLFDGSTKIYPWNVATNSGADNQINLGTASTRFKNLYLSGGVHLGGTGSANYLDDYEEGTWTPTASTGMTFHNAACTYTKVGRLVTLHITITMQGSSNTANQVAILGLPFASANTYRTDGVPWMDFFACGYADGIPHAGITGGGRTQIDHWVPRSNTLANQLTLLPNMMNSGNHTEYQLTLTYLAA